jgi:hypothetical protein
MLLYLLNSLGRVAARWGEHDRNENRVLSFWLGVFHFYSN